MTARPGRVFTELAIDAPYPRDERFRTSAQYAAFCRLASEALADARAASREGRHEQRAATANARRASRAV